MKTLSVAFILGDILAELKEINANTKKAKRKPVKKDDGKELHLDFVRLSDSEWHKLNKKFGYVGTKTRIVGLNNYAHQFKRKFNQYTSHYHTILNWSRDKEVREKTQFEKDMEEGL